MVNGPVSFSGLVSGLNTQSIINAEMAVYEQPLTSLQNEQSAINAKISAYQTINSQLLALQQASDALADPTSYEQAFTTASSNASEATASVTSGTQSGTLTFAVDQLATGSTQISAGTVASPNDVVASGDLLVGSGGAGLGIASFGTASGLASGAHTITVTQSSSGAALTGTAPLASSVTIDGSNDQLSVVVDGSAQTLTLASGTYDAQQLAQAVTHASGGTLNATVTTSGLLSVATTQQGSTASLQVTGGSAGATLGLAPGSAVTGTDGVIDLDGTATTVNDIAGSGTTAVTLSSGTGGTLQVQLEGGLTAGSITAQNVSVGNGSLSTVIDAINASGVGVTANALQVGANQYALELTSNGTGTAASTTIDAGAFATSGLGALTTTTASQNAVISIGGTGGYQVVSASNQVTGLLPGVTVNLGQASSSPVTITVSPDGTQLATTVQTLVTAANQVLSTISTDTAYNASTNTAATLNGATSLNGLAQQILAAVGTAVGTSGAGSDGTAGESAGLAITSQGTITFNQAAFEAAYAKNPAAVQAMFTEGGTFTPASSPLAGAAAVAGATDNTSPGSYAVTVSQSAAQAVDTGSATWSAPTSALAAAETYTVTSGSATATYAAAAGESITDVISGLNSSLANAGIGTSAALVGSAGAYQLQLATAAYGSAATFSVSASGADQLGLTSAGSTFSGVDVAGTIDGVAATGVGQELSLLSSGDPANGLVVTVSAMGITTPTTLGTINYAPGFAQGLAHMAKTSSLAPSGLVPETIAGLQGTLSEVNSEITMQQQLVATQQAALTQEFTNLEATLSKLQATSSFLNAQSGTSSLSSSSNLSSSNTSSSSSGSSSG
jgi:flagellar hook-associated protein 2